MYCPDGGRHEGGVILVQASVWNVGTSDFDVKGAIQMQKHKDRVPKRSRGAE